MNAVAAISITIYLMCRASESLCCVCMATHRCQIQATPIVSASLKCSISTYVLVFMSDQDMCLQ